MIHRLFIVLAALCLASYAAAPEAGPSRYTLVLATAKGVDIPKLTVEEVRSLFMGAPMVKHDVRLKPLLNETDPLLREVFLQKIMFVSWKHYQRRLVEQAFREGWPLPESVSNPANLSDALSQHPGAITYMWERSAQQSNVKVLQTLWSGPID